MDLIQTLLDGLMVGGLYATVAIGVTLVFGIMGILNFAHGQLVMLGAYTAFFVVSAGLGFWPALVVGMVAMGALGFLLERFVFRFTLTDHMQGLTASLGLIMVIENLAAAAFTPDPRNFEPPLPGSFQIAGLTLSSQRMLVLGLVIVLVVGCYLFLQKTRIGKAIRAMGQNRTGAALVGIQTSQVTAVVFVLGSAMAGAAGVLYGSLFAITPYMAAAPLMKGFILTVLGGLGSVQGAVLAGFLLGLAESLGSRYLSASFRDGYGFILLIIALLYFPRGLFGHRGKVRV
ncbi:MAG: branched-chain amino acid ABC transporter permease [Gammaproteobacteria bacterium]|nr:branched-chain amino acid ABC transporter permease [Gammaproteobacteria bacterium]MBU1444044.1 branched-chain amino acid ABC transporter permease [Gammaproteobacteria bacterium]MBU2287790.1 branched-chain amino acid ABC transporter permease [Gammaproteobacteria bacterium]MBU2410397.1 branched-chain amino acid ABC transporter permease [Gammaproteobacteria bacterium]